MPDRKTGPDHARLDRLTAEARRAGEERAKGYREQALKIYPWVCGRCGRDFTYANPQLLEVHHRRTSRPRRRAGDDGVDGDASQESVECW